MSESRRLDEINLQITFALAIAAIVIATSVASMSAAQERGRIALV
jgi:hypothetical protein